MQSEHREYSLQELPLAKMGCGGKSYQPPKTSGAPTYLPSAVGFVIIGTLLRRSAFSQ